MQQKIETLRRKESVSRNEIQALCLEIPKGNVLLTWATRIGKMLGGLNCVRQGEKVLIVSPTLLINQDWEQAIQRYPGMDYKVICYASIQNELDQYDVVILDEVHHLSERVLSVLKGWRARFIGLSGTLPYEPRMRWNKLTNQNFFEWTIALDQGINWGILPPPQVVCVGLELQNDKRVLLYHKGKDKKKKNEVVQYGYHKGSLFNRSVNTLIQCTEKEWNQLIEDDIAYWKSLEDNPNSNVSPYIISNNINRLGNERKRMLSQLKNKHIKRAVRHFKLEDKRIIVFCNDIPQAEWVDESYAIHSKKKDNKGLIDQFNEGEINKLVSVNMLNEGINLHNVDAALIVQVSNSQVRSQQQSARTLLSELPLVIILYYRNTRDQEYVNNFVKQFNPKYVKWVNVSSHK